MYMFSIKIMEIKNYIKLFLFKVKSLYIHQPNLDTCKHYDENPLLFFSHIYKGYSNVINRMQKYSF